MANNKSEQPPISPEAEVEASVNQKGLSKEAWAAMSAIVVALISGIFAILTTLIPTMHLGQSSSSPTTIASSSLEPSPSPERSPSQTPELSPSLAPKSSPFPVPQTLLLALSAANINYSVSKAQIVSWLGTPGTEYPQIAASCLTLLPDQRLKNEVALDVIVYDYKLVARVPVEKLLPLNHIVDREKLKQAIVNAYNDRYNSGAQSFVEIVEPL